MVHSFARLSTLSQKAQTPFVESQVIAIELSNSIHPK